MKQNLTKEIRNRINQSKNHDLLFQFEMKSNHNLFINLRKQKTNALHQVPQSNS
jgi:hypothetical protein